MSDKNKSKDRESQSITVADVGMVGTVDSEEFSLDQFNTVTDVSQFVEKLSTGHLEWAYKNGLIGEKLIVLKAGQVVRGRFMGEGPSITLVNKTQLNKATGEVGPPTVRTWRLEHESGNFIRIMGGHQLDRELPEVPLGALVQVIHGGQVDTGNGQRANNMLVQYPRRNAILDTPDAAKAIEASVSQAS